MILKKLKNIIFLPLFLFLISCGGNENQIQTPEKIPPLNILYKDAFKNYEKGEWRRAISLFQKVETRYSFSEWSPRATLMIMYIYYEVGERIKTLEYAKKFKNLYLKNKDLDYVEFIIGLTFYEEINVISRDQTNSEAALDQFKKIINLYPTSIYAEEAKLKIDLINEQLAGNHMYIARYYMKKSKWIAAIKRLEIIINDYQTTIYVKEALHRLVEIYYRLGNIKESKKYAALLGYNFNDSDWYKKSYKIIADKDYIIKKEEKQKRKLRDRVKKLFQFSK